MPVRETAAICIISTTAGVATFWVLRKRLSLLTSCVIHDDEDMCTVYLNLRARGQPNRSTQRPGRCSAARGAEPPFGKWGWFYPPAWRRAIGTDPYPSAIAMMLSMAA